MYLYLFYFFNNKLTKANFDNVNKIRIHSKQPNICEKRLKVCAQANTPLASKNVNEKRKNQS